MIFTRRSGTSRSGASPGRQMSRQPEKDPRESMGLRIALLVGLAGAAYVGVEFALGYWKSWLLAASIVALAIALYFLIWPTPEE